MRSIGVVSVGRSDYGIYLPILRRVQAERDLKLTLFVSGMHLSPHFGLTVREIESDGFEIAERVEMLVSSDTPEGIAKSIGLGVIGFSQAFMRSRPDILVILGDRFDMYAAAVAALPFKIPVAHIHGGEITYGAIDDALRHSMTKLSHLHFVSTEAYRQRVEQLGEEPWRITVSGAPGLDHVHTLQFLTASELEARYHLRLDPAPLLVTFHPVTLEYEQVEWQIDELLSALEMSNLPVIFTMPNADTGNSVVRKKITGFSQTHARVWCLDNLGTQAYFSMMKHAAAMVGNSSSGILEAASLKLPVVNVGTRQGGRLRAANVIDAGYGHEEIGTAIRKATAPAFRKGLRTLQNPYGDGHAAERIVECLKTVGLDERLLAKRFFDASLVSHPEGAK
jgi:UDP-N-acetylglucosamine 2-epimerase (non-hydrolysing)/GDP/UDP-N,N'-diacetylbacillosamine 2-epimerase (hydrolysing)